MTEPVVLRVDWCSYEAAKYAVEHWHYSRRMPRSKLATIGVWENGVFVGAVIFGYGATPQIGSPYGLTQYQICELVRVALSSHKCFVSEILSLSLRALAKKNPDLRLIVSFADSAEGHIGGIYQATNWIYAGHTDPARVGFIIKGKKTHTRTIGLIPGGVQSLEWVRKNIDTDATEWIGEEKYRYLYPLDRAMRKQITPLAQPYPKKHAGEVSNGDTLADQVGGAGSIPAARSNTSD